MSGGFGSVASAYNTVTRLSMACFRNIFSLSCCLYSIILFFLRFIISASIVVNLGFGEKRVDGIRNNSLNDLGPASASVLGPSLERLTRLSYLDLRFVRAFL